MGTFYSNILFDFLGIRSDSDMYTFGFSWKIWKSAKPIAPAEDILAYLKEAAKEQGIIEKTTYPLVIQCGNCLRKSISLGGVVSQVFTFVYELNVLERDH